MTPASRSANAPFVIPASDLPAPEVTSPELAPPPPDDAPAGAAMLTVTRFAAHRTSRLARLFWTALSGLLTFMISVAAYDYVTNLIARSPTLGAIALGLFAALALAAFIQILRELWAFRRLARLDAFHADAASVLATGDRTLALSLSRRLLRFYAHRPELTAARDSLSVEHDAILDADALLAQTERALFTPLDAAVRVEIERASRTVATATAVLPVALMDVLAAAVTNIRMIRRVAEIYGAHAGFFGSWRLLSTVAAHLLATGALAVGDDMVHSVLGGSLAAKLSRRFGEGVVNGALTVRVGVAAMDVCRPLPFATLPRPRVSIVAGRALAGVFQKT